MNANVILNECVSNESSQFRLAVTGGFTMLIT